MKKFILTMLIIGFSLNTAANCEFNGKSYGPLESVTVFEPSYYKLSKQQQVLYADGAALIVVCTPVLDMKQLDQNNWSKRNLKVTHNVWAAADNNWLYGKANLNYPDRVVTHTGF